MNTFRRVRVKICGFTRAADVAAAVQAGADAIGLNCYPASPRFAALSALPALAAELPPFVTPVLLFVNAAADEVRRALEVVPDALLQFHGDETEADCRQYARPYLRAVRMAPDVSLLNCERSYASAAALLADAPVAGFGGGGQRFDWSRIPPPAARRKPLVLAGGLDESNVAEAVRAVQPYAVDVSSGVESGKGIKDPARIARFIAAVRGAEQSSNQ
ncbi:MAG: phosphoribosylanthranilate isomerase [Burkholderiaceae bacterium]|jgi:phosphoribosylanthranilate isomerase|nr:phosphoribosylanthranilate isomerase [Burkholderiaceae bacterium]